MPTRPTTERLNEAAEKAVSNRLLTIVLTVVGALFTALIGGGGYFATTMAEKVDQANVTLSQIKEKVAAGGERDVAQDARLNRLDGRVDRLEAIHTR